MVRPDVRAGVRLAELTTLRLGGPARCLVTVDTEADLIDEVRRADEAAEPLLVLGGGSNLVVSDAGFDGTVVRVATRGRRVQSRDTCAGVVLDAAAGEPWDAVVAEAVSEGWAGVEALSGIPGLAGATPIQNVGAYGQQISDVVSRVRTYDRVRRAVRTFAAAECGFGYRDSLFKGTDRWVVLSVELQLARGALGAPLRYRELARRLGLEEGGRAGITDVRDAVLSLRGGKGMVLDADDRDTWSAGSFFTNPRLRPADAARLPVDAPRWPDGDLVKTSAAWLIEHAGFARGHGSGPARLSTKHTLALTNRGDATTAELLALAREVRDGVRDRFGVELVNEPVLVGVDL